MNPIRNFKIHQTFKFLFCVGLPLGGLTAQVSLPEQVVVSTRSESSLERLPTSVSVITQETIENRQYSKVSEALRQEPGMNLVQLGGRGGQTSLFVRGTNSNHTSFLLAGRRLNPGFSGTYSIAQLGTAGLSQIEIQRSGGSLLYGAEGIGGVVQLTPYTWAEESGWSGQVGSEGGSRSSARGDVVLRYRSEEEKSTLWGANLATSYEETANFSPNNRYSHYQALPRFLWSYGPNLQLDLTGLYYSSSLGLPGSERSFDYPKSNDYQENQFWLISPGLEWQLVDDLRLKAFYSRSEEYLKSLNESPSFPFFYDFWVFQDELDLQLTWDLSEDISVTGGANYRSLFYRSDDRTTGTEATRERLDQWGVFGQIEWDLPWELLLTTGVRVDDYSAFGTPTTGQIRLAKQVSEWDSGFFFQVATAYAPPTANDLFPPFGNPDIRPEESTNWELGWRQGWFERKVVTTVTLFNNEISDLIEFDFDTFSGRNIGSARTQGVETGIRWSIQPNWDLFAHYTYLEAKDTRANTRLLRRPRHTYGGGMEGYLIPSLLVGVELRGVVDRVDGFAQQEKLEDYTVVRIYTSWKSESGLELLGRVENALDRRGEIAQGFRENGLQLFAGARYRF